MAALVCEICGGKLKGKPRGIYECEFCGVEYDTAWAKAKIQEIKGTVRIEGTVQVAGSVKIEGSINVDSLLKRAALELEDGQWTSADNYYNKVLDIDPENVQAYLGKLLAEQQVKTEDQLLNVAKNFDDSIHYRKILRFADDELCSRLKEYNAIIRERNEKERIAREEQDRAKHTRQKKIAPELQTIRKNLAIFRHLISVCNTRTIGARSDGTLLTTDDGFWNTEEWQNLAAVCTTNTLSAGLRCDGTVVSNGGDRHDAGDWTNIVAVRAGAGYIVGLLADGTVKIVGGNIGYKPNLYGWENITDIAVSSNCIMGVRADGMVEVSQSGNNFYRAYEWEDIVQISVSHDLAVGLHSNGTVEVDGRQALKEFDQYVSDWSEIVSISTGCEHVVGLRADGTVVAAGDNENGQCNVSDWKNIVAICASDIHTVGLCADGTIVAAGSNENGECKVEKWKLFENRQQLEQAQKETREKRIAWNEQEAQ